MSKWISLTKAQLGVLEFIESFRAEYGVSPTYFDIREFFGWSSHGTVYKHLRELERKGWIRRGDNQTRSIDVLRPSSMAKTDHIRFAAYLFLRPWTRDGLDHDSCHLLCQVIGSAPVAELSQAGDVEVELGIHEFGVLSAVIHLTGMKVGFEARRLPGQHAGVLCKDIITTLWGSEEYRIQVTREADE